MADVVIFEQDADEFEDKTLADLIEWLQDILADHQKGEPELFFGVEQSGDSWDGYSCATIRVYREETAAEERERCEQEAMRQAAYKAQQRQRETEMLRALIAKHGVPDQQDGGQP